MYSPTIITTSYLHKRLVASSAVQVAPRTESARNAAKNLPMPHILSLSLVEGTGVAKFAQKFYTSCSRNPHFAGALN